MSEHITAEEAAALQTALGQLQAALDAVTRERDEARAEVERLREERDTLRAEAQRMRAERDTLLLDARDFVQWFSAYCHDPSAHPDHPWCVINDRLKAHADTLAALDAAAAKTDKGDGR